MLAVLPQVTLIVKILQIVVMARYRTALRPINRIKHVVDTSAVLAAGTQIDNVLALATDTPTLASTVSVETGSKINGFYIRVEVASNDAQVTGAIPNVYMMIWKNTGGNLTAPVANGVGGSDNKRFVIHQEMVMIQNVVSSNPRTLFNGVIAVPKGMRRMAPNDRWDISILSPQLDISFCYQAHYKEFR